MRRRGTSIVDYNGGYLVVSSDGKSYMLPGGSAEPEESRFEAAIRELREETGLIAYSAEIIFRHVGSSSEHTVVLIKAKGIPKPSQEIRFIASHVEVEDSLFPSTKEIIQRMKDYKNSH